MAALARGRLVALLSLFLGGCRSAGPAPPEPRREAPPIRAERYQPIAWGAPSPGASGRESLEIQAAVLNHLFQHNHSHDEELPNHAICIGIGPDLPLVDPPQELMSLLQPTDLPQHPASSCDLDLEHRYRGSRHIRLILTKTDQPAIAFWVNVPQDIAGGRVQVRAGYYEGGISSAGYRCSVDGKDGEWTVLVCELTRIS